MIKVIEQAFGKTAEIEHTPVAANQEIVFTIESYKDELKLIESIDEGQGLLLCRILVLCSGEYG